MAPGKYSPARALAATILPYFLFVIFPSARAQPVKTKMGWPVRTHNIKVSTYGNSDG
jgi:hypothetical protein